MSSDQKTQKKYAKMEKMIPMKTDTFKFKKYHIKIERKMYDPRQGSR